MVIISINIVYYIGDIIENLHINIIKNIKVKGGFSIQINKLILRW